MIIKREWRVICCVITCHSVFFIPFTIACESLYQFRFLNPYNELQNDVIDFAFTCFPIPLRQ